MLRFESVFWAAKDKQIPHQMRCHINKKKKACCGNSLLFSDGRFKIIAQVLHFRN